MGGCATTPDMAYTAATCPSKEDDAGEIGCTTNCTHIQTEPASAFKSLGWLDRFLAIWILLAMVVGVLLGNFVSGVGEALQKGHFVGVSIPIAVGLLVMMYPILCKVRFESLHQVFAQRAVWTQIAFSIAMNWIVAPLFMSFKVLVWTGLAAGDSDYCAILVAINSLLQMVLFAPLSVLYIRIISRDSGTISVSYTEVATSVGVFLGIPFGAAVVTRILLRRIAGEEWYNRVFIRIASPWSLIGLLYTILVLFASQGHAVVHQIVGVLRVAAPLVVYFVVIFTLTLWITYRMGFGYALATTQSFTAASNNFELAIAVAVATFGPNSDQALAATVGPLIEVPVLLGLVYLVRWLGKRWNWDR
ncbi:arsenical-resistance protein [Ophiostoma piceae UAMH 11346]|uniref:Arsenical-resistance protein n=1 Tax=Ophiostoma piceae (strain UAMH 11346) TaxID=1262450 RepID=S3CDP5_OPHP1|nr:arsenical-resistance protein [Ophiostoma piceae UAMH 11346]